MDDTSSNALPDAEGDSNSSTITRLANEVGQRLQQRTGAPSLALLVKTLEEVRGRLPDIFDEQILLLRTLRRSIATHVKKAGKIELQRDLQEFIHHLEMCGEIPGHSFGLVVERVPLMDPYSASRYLEGTRWLVERAGRRAPERRLIALLAGIEHRNTPFAWTEAEWKMFDAVELRHKANLAGLLGTGPTVREELPVTYQPEPAKRAKGGRAKRMRDKLEWDATVADLVAITHALKKAKFLVAYSTTDEAVLEHFDYGSQADDPGESFRQIRLKLRVGDVHLSNDKIDKLIAILKELRGA